MNASHSSTYSFPKKGKTMTMAFLQRTRLFRRRQTVKGTSQPQSTTSNSDSSLHNTSTPPSSGSVPITSISSYNESQILDYSAVIAPRDYIRSLPSKDIRKKLIEAFNIWFQLSENATNFIGQIINDLHNASLILDDIQDHSLLRRGNPATHCVFGNAQSINSAIYMIMNTGIILQQTLPANSAAMDVLLKGVIELSVGQSWELKWKFHNSCPSVPEYMAMIDGKTGAMFNILVRLMHLLSHRGSRLSLPELDRLATLLGRFYQVRDDYINLQDDSYSEQKGFCEDLDEGKFSFPIISCFNADPVAREIILGIFRQNGDKESILSRNIKTYILDLIKGSGAFEATRELLDRLSQEIWAVLLGLEVSTGLPNPALRGILEALLTF